MYSVHIVHLQRWLHCVYIVHTTSSDTVDIVIDRQQRWARSRVIYCRRCLDPRTVLYPLWQWRRLWARCRVIRWRRLATRTVLYLWQLQRLWARCRVIRWRRLAPRYVQYCTCDNDDGCEHDAKVEVVIGGLLVRGCLHHGMLFSFGLIKKCVKWHGMPRVMK